MDDSFSFLQGDDSGLGSLDDYLEPVLSVETAPVSLFASDAMHDGPSVVRLVSAEETLQSHTQPELLPVAASPFLIDNPPHLEQVIPPVAGVQEDEPMLQALAPQLAATTTPTMITHPSLTQQQQQQQQQPTSAASNNNNANKKMIGNNSNSTPPSSSPSTTTTTTATTKRRVAGKSASGKRRAHQTDMSKYEHLAPAERKRLIRLERNRASAQLSRERKKHHVTELEEQLRGVCADKMELQGTVARLVKENEYLKQRVAELEAGQQLPQLSHQHLHPAHRLNNPNQLLVESMDHEVASVGGFGSSDTDTSNTPSSSPSYGSSGRDKNPMDGSGSHPSPFRHPFATTAFLFALVFSFSFLYDMSGLHFGRTTTQVRSANAGSLGDSEVYPRRIGRVLESVPEDASDKALVHRSSDVLSKNIPSVHDLMLLPPPELHKGQQRHTPASPASRDTSRDRFVDGANFTLDASQINDDQSYMFCPSAVHTLARRDAKAHTGVSHRLGRLGLLPSSASSSSDVGGSGDAVFDRFKLLVPSSTLMLEWVDQYNSTAGQSEVGGIVEIECQIEQVRFLGA